MAAHDVRSGGLLLWRAARWISGGVVLAVVDPGVATDRRAVALRVEGSDAVTHLVGPDNGLMMPAVSALGRLAAAVELVVETAHTFAGRDTFAPAAAALATGTPVAELGRALDTRSLVAGVLPAPRIGADRLEAEILWIDTFGNAQLNLRPGHLPSSGPVELDTGRTRLRVRVVGSYRAIGADRYALVVDSYGQLAICSDRAPAAPALGLKEGDAVVLRTGPPPP